MGCDGREGVLAQPPSATATKTPNARMQAHPKRAETEKVCKDSLQKGDQPTEGLALVKQS
jgi:hypothetical protein